ncbi:MAG: DUF3810 family protein [Saprospiraceae bacterium]
MKYKNAIIFTAIFTLILYNILPYSSVFVEEVYSGGLFQYIRLIHDNTIGYMPFATVYLVAGALFFLSFSYFSYFKNKVIRYAPFWKCVSVLLFDLCVLISIVLILFYWMWAFNYKRLSFEEKNNLAKVEITEDWLFNEIKITQDTLVALYGQRSLQYNHEATEKLVRNSIAKILYSTDYEVSGKARIRQLQPKGFLLIWSTAGVYLPFVSEGHIDKGLPTLTKPFTLAHEMSHAYGIPQESTCNFTAFLACIITENPSIRYSGWLGYFRYLLSAARRTNPERYKAFYQKSINSMIVSDLQLIYNTLNEYPDILPKLRYFLYDSYLKSHGVTEGMISYSRMIYLAASWKSKNGNFIID